MQGNVNRESKRDTEREKIQRLIVRNIKGKLFYVGYDNNPENFFWIERISKGRYVICKSGEVKKFDLDLSYYKSIIRW